MTRPATVVVVGDALVDVVVRPLESVQPGSDTASTIRWRSGGAAANVARAIADQGGRARLVARVGDDVAGTFLTDSLQRHGVAAQLLLYLFLSHVFTRQCWASAPRGCAFGL